MGYDTCASERDLKPMAGGAPQLHYWEVVWNRLHQAGWRLGHTTWTSAETGGIRHYVYARRGGDWVEYSAPTMTEAVCALARAVRETEHSGGAAQPRHQEAPGF